MSPNFFEFFKLSEAFTKEDLDKAYFRKLKNVESLNISIADKDFINDPRVQALLQSQGHLQTLADLITNVGDNNISHTCFAAGTLVHTEQGLIAIEQLKVGDKVDASMFIKTAKQKKKGN